MKVYRTALYMRLSRDDGDKEESDSIGNQRVFLKEYIRGKKEFNFVREYTDDGYSGTNSKRPSFQRMITLVKQQVIKTVIVKDFSRFGRDYIEVGDYIERIFPFIGVRFLSVNDGYDSKLYPVGSEKDLEIIIKNVINAYYSRDLSGKITSSIQSRLNRGKYVYASRAFGYLEDPKDRTKIVIDPEAGRIVRTIFDMALTGMRISTIAECLNREGIPTCGQYNARNAVRGKNKPLVKSAYQYWTADMVIRILTNPVYKGTFISSKYKRIVPGVNKSRKRTAQEQTVLLHHHEAIVTDEEFEQAQNIFQGNRPKPVLPYKKYPLKGKIICANCGRVMQYHERKVIDCFYTCPMPEQIKEISGCSREHFQEGVINAFVLSEWKKEMQSLYLLGQNLKREEERQGRELEDLEEKEDRLQKYLQELQSKRLIVYEEYSEGKISRENFISMREALLTEMEEMKLRLQVLDEQKRELKKIKRRGSTEFQQLLKKMKSFENAQTLTKVMTDIFLDRLTVHDMQHMELRWKWEKLVQEMIMAEQS